MINIKLFQNKKLVLDYVTIKEINLEEVKRVIDGIGDKVKYKSEFKDGEFFIKIETDDNIFYDITDLQVLIKQNIINPKIEIEPEIQEQQDFDEKLKESLLRLGFTLPRK